MGWWRIDPDTGQPLPEGRSKLSRPPDLVLLNAVPGVDGSEEAHYLGDGPWDMVDDAVREVEALLGDRPRPSGEEARRLFRDRVIPPGLAGLQEVGVGQRFQQIRRVVPGSAGQGRRGPVADVSEPE